MQNIYFEGVYYDPELITDKQKEYMKKTNETKYNQFAKTFNWEVKKDESSVKRYSTKKHSKIR